MPRHDWRDWRDDETMMRERSGYRRDRDHDHRDRDRGAFFDRGRDEERGRRIGGWGGMMGDDDREPMRGRGRERTRGRDEDRHYGSDEFNRGIPMDETSNLIASNKVEGTPVYDRHGDKIGTVHNFMVDKRKGQVVYAVLKHGGGFLGLGERYYPLEWDQLTFDTRMEGYHVDLDEDELQNFGSFDSDGRYHRRQIRGEQGRERSHSRDRW